MKVEWLNDQRTKAQVTRGWFRKRSAEVYIDTYSRWSFVQPDLWVSWWLARQLRKARCNSPWQPVAKLPAARVVSE